MSSTLTIGEFACATHLSVKTLRHYHSIGLLTPARVDADTGYRYYSLEQITPAQLIRRFRALEMPLDQIGALIATADVDTRNRLLGAHLERLEHQLVSTQAAVASLKDLLHAPASAQELVQHRSIPAVRAASISQEIVIDDAAVWWAGAYAELLAFADAHELPAKIPGGSFASTLFADERGLATLFIPVDRPIREQGRVRQITVPAAELAVTTHLGSPSQIDLAYGRLAAHVARHELGVDGPLREHYPVGPAQTTDESQWTTDVGWPIFPTASTTDS